MSSQADRYAIYFMPHPDSAFWRFGSAVLGYDAASGDSVPQIGPEGFDLASWRLLTADPRAYGFHATIKAPFRLAQGVGEQELVAEFGRFAAAQTPFDLPRLEAAAIEARAGKGAFIALVEPVAKPATPALLALEHAAVEAFEPFRAPLTDKEFARRLPERLTERERANLDRYGYPFVHEDFRFHLTLTGLVPSAQVEAARAGLAALHAEQVGIGPVPVDGLGLFRQEAGEPNFKVLTRVPFGGARE